TGTDSERSCSSEAMSRPSARPSPPPAPISRASGSNLPWASTPAWPSAAARQWPRAPSRRRGMSPKAGAPCRWRRRRPAWASARATTRAESCSPRPCTPTWGAEMGRQTTAKADARRRKKTARTSAATSAATVTATSSKSAATKKPRVENPTARGTSTAKRPAAEKSAATKTTAKRPTTGKPAATKTTPGRKPPAKKSAGRKPPTKSTAGTKSSTGAKSTATATGTAKSTSVLRHAWAHLREDFARVSAYPLTTYYLILVSVLALTGLGLVMVLSASSITSYDGGEGSSFAYFNSRALFAGIGIALMIVASLMPLRVCRGLAWWAMLGSVVMQAAVFVPGFGKEAKGNANWIGFGGLQVQPSEFLKVALALW